MESGPLAPGNTIPLVKLPSLRPLNRRAARHFLEGLLALLPESGRWTRPERDEWMTLCRYLVDWLVLVDDEPGEGDRRSPDHSPQGMQFPW